MIDSKRILVVAPHPDDEVIGCGGTIALCAERGAEVHLLVVFDGAAGDPEHKFEAHSYVAKRQAEARAAGEQLGVSQYTFWDLPEGHLATEAEVEQGAERLRSFVNEVQPDLILAPWWGDNHRDHQSVAKALTQLVDQGTLNVELWGFGVWSPVEAERSIDVSGVWTKKLEAIKHYSSQLAYDDLVGRMHNLAGRSETGLYEYFRRWRKAA